MSNSGQVFTVSFPLPAADWAGNDVTGHIMEAPTSALGGGLTIIEAAMVNAAATNAGTAFSLQLENWGTGGAAIKAAGGTIASAAGGTGAPFTADTPISITLTAANVFVDAGEWVVVRKAEDGSSDPTRGVLVIKYVMGK